LLCIITRIEQEYRKCEKNLARLLFSFVLLPLAT